MKTILALTDFSEVSAVAVETGFRMAKEHEGRLLIMHVLSAASTVQLNLDAEDEGLSVDGQEGEKLAVSLQKWKSQASALNIQVSLLLSSGDVVSSVQNTAAREDVELVIMGATGQGANDSIWGTTTQQVVKKLQSPVLVVKGEPVNTRPSTIVFASDLDPEDKEALTGAITLLRPPKDAEIHLMSVNTSSFASQPRHLMTALLNDFKKVVEPYHADSTFYTDYSIVAGIKHFVEVTTPELLIMSSRKRNPIKELFVPDSAVKAIGVVPCPVLIMK